MTGYLFVKRRRPMIHFFCEGHEVTRQCLGIKFLTGLFLTGRRGPPTVDVAVISVLISDPMYEVQRRSRHFTFKFSRVRIPPPDLGELRFKERGPKTQKR